MSANVADRLIAGFLEKRNISCVGLDPRPERIPDHIKQRALREHGNTKEAVASAIVDFNTLLIDAVADIVAAVKPQIAFYEQYGPHGVVAFKRTVDYAKEKGLFVIEDGKRNDIDSTAEAYANGHLGRVKLLDGKTEEPMFDVDMITVTPYLGIDGVKPFLEVARKYGKGPIVLDRTSNKSAGDLQDRLVELESWQRDLINERLDQETLQSVELPANLIGADFRRGVVPNYMVMATLIDRWGSDLIGERGYSSVGAVVGATYPAEARLLRKIMPRTKFLIPGYGAAQGGKAEDMPLFLNPDGYGGIVNAAREIIFAYTSDRYKNDFPPTRFADAARQAALDMKAAITREMEKAGKVPW